MPGTIPAGLRKPRRCDFPSIGRGQTMKLWLFGSALALTVLSAPAQVMPDQQQGQPSLSTGTVPLTYTGADNRVSVGIDQDGHSQGELLGVFGNNGERAYVGQFWWGYGGA